MADEAGPSGVSKPVAQEALAEADAKFERGIQCIRANEIEQAAQLFAEVLEVRAQHFGELAPECASAYYRYGAALLYQAQDSSDVFGAGVQEGAEEEQDDDEEEAAAAADKENGGKDKGKAPVEAAAEGVEDEGEEGEAGEATDGDLQLAWENLETAKVIWTQQGAEQHAQQLADVHVMLADVAMESDDFSTALTELDAALAHLGRFAQPDDRRIAEVQYKRCCALQFSGEVEAALPAVQAACDVLVKRREALAAKLAQPAEGSDAEALQAEDTEVAALLEDLKEKVAELQELIAQNADTKSMLKGAFAQLAAANGAAGGTAAAGSGSGGGGGGGGAVQNLGVVGRGTKRLNLQPVQDKGQGVMPPAAAAAQPPAKKKRSLEDLMGGADGGETTIGFGTAPADGGKGSPALALPADQAAAAAPPAVPAFLQAASVQAVFGGEGAEGPTPEQQ